ncbi:MAG: iron chelate uptake ABC transporter family permease subunit [Chloroflexi bacterium]|nr:iron chelate uptake ABC transporter family permease subunit [Chloroflexota bacterium]
MVSAKRGIRARLAIALAALAALLLVAAIVAAAHGPVRVSYPATASIILRHIGINTRVDYSSTAQRVIEQIRLPRIFLAALVGMALAAAGATMQGLFRNPMAEPGTIGVSSGGALGAVIAIATGLGSMHHYAVPAMAFLGATAAGFLVYAIAAGGLRFSMATLLLAGIAVNAFLAASISFVITYTADDLQVMRQIVFWLAGGLDGHGWADVRMVAPPILAGSAVLFVYSRDLNLMLLGEAEAQALGVRVQWTRRLLLACAALVTGVAVSVSGTIGFVGLVVPHILRLALGPDNRLLLPASALAGASFLVAADTVARLVVQPAELQVGVVTAFVGAPFFLFLLQRNRQRASLL